MEESGGVWEDEDGTRRQLEEAEEPEDHPVVFTIQRIENGVEVGAASISGVRMAVHDENPPPPVAWLSLKEPSVKRR